jgi:hypothetical protein
LGFDGLTFPPSRHRTEIHPTPGLQNKTRLQCRSYFACAAARSAGATAIRSARAETCV